MAPMTARGADEPTDAMVDYYRQRAGAGLVITEGIFPSADGKGYCRTPGLVTDVQVAGWKRVTEAVHAEGGTIVAQIMHCGRVTHEDNKDPSSETVAPSAIRARGEMYTDTGGMQPISEPRALRTEEIPGVIAEFTRATELAYEAGFDGVEAHCASGYLPAQFLSTGTNQRDDEYGGSLEPRSASPSTCSRPWRRSTARTAWASGSARAIPSTTSRTTTLPRPSKRFSRRRTP